jgi:hypothetical protein
VANDTHRRRFSSSRHVSSHGAVVLHSSEPSQQSQMPSPTRDGWTALAAAPGFAHTNGSLLQAPVRLSSEPQSQKLSLTYAPGMTWPVLHVNVASVYGAGVALEAGSAKTPHVVTLNTATRTLITANRQQAHRQHG